MAAVVISDYRASQRKPYIGGDVEVAYDQSSRGFAALPRSEVATSARAIDLAQRDDASSGLSLNAPGKQDMRTNNSRTLCEPVYALRLPKSEDYSQWIARRFRCAICTTDAEFVELIRWGRPTGIIWSVDPRSTLDADVVDAILDLGQRRPVVLRSVLTAPITLIAFQLASQLKYFRLSLASAQDSSSICDWFENGAPKGADHVVLQRIGADVDELMSRPIAAALASAGRRIKVAELAAACDTSTRTLQDQLHRGGCLTASDIIAWSVCLHLAWRVEGADPIIKRAASAAGFASSSDLSNYVLRHLGTRPTQLRRQRGFGELLEAFARLVAKTSPALAQASADQLRFPPSTRVAGYRPERARVAFST